MAMTKAEFKRRWELNDRRDGITNDEVAECAKAWGLFDRPKCVNIAHVIKTVVRASGAIYEESHTDFLKDLIGDAGYEAFEYSGRGMYGKQCIAFTCEDVTSGLMDLVKALNNDTLEAFQSLRVKYDTLGMGVVVYFPEVEYE